LVRRKIAATNFKKLLGKRAEEISQQGRENFGEKGKKCRTEEPIKGVRRES